MTNEHRAVIDDLSAYLIAGRVVSALPENHIDQTAARTVVQGIQDGAEAEQLGFANVYLSERWNLKEAGVVLGAVGARTTRVGLGTGLVSPARRHVLHMAAFGATMHAAFGPRFLLGLGRGDHAYLRHEGLQTAGFAGVVDYVKILRRLWDGEVVSYDGPAGTYRDIKLGDIYVGPAPKMLYGTFGMPKASAAVARAFDGVILPPMMSPDATSRSVTRLRQACETIGRDPHSLRIVQCVVTAPDLDIDEARALAHARAVTYLQAPEYGAALAKVNEWDLGPVEKIRSEVDRMQNGAGDELADTAFHRIQLMDVARLVPDEWMDASCAFGTATQCADKLREFKQAGADEISTYGSTPGQNADVLAAWRRTTTAVNR
ncbi:MULTISPECIES: TIGR03857 family LLM class F420-dependent oxidoreductase [Mycolicibacterium]|uniref:TIGR03857 family LLM class F420-dependent oxidoreductase n=2 Tax=Mycolicibacterium TaxID=1866885 RepID=A0A4Z0HXV4_MYCPR|nr:MULTISPECIES: TIGR03857 family LLM class F420-dependent oxidoreductase [Mycolicibacterium]CDO30912.1 luciferase family protein [Mycolicibacterium vulneris]MCV7388751.1 TIGR03857 family LLM class F420-dependent oxidoreductase [Mycolicibacterium porcinum]ORB34855.1 LLM class F420-dependent oxidoreductase [Mycolicibacterium porcinum]TGB45535.1 TIGR03857 family LLM class F420-dependent oxidoreductase [Mycolicibacterium peregrinum]TGB47733.1 TIGR03857 family LLM class F420-dependent oxidoreducta